MKYNRILSFALILLLLLQPTVFAEDEIVNKELPAPSWVTTESIYDENDRQQISLTITTPENFKYPVDLYRLEYKNGSSFVIDSPEGGTVFFTESTIVSICYLSDGKASPSYSVEIIIGIPKSYSDTVTGVKADIDEGVETGDTFSVTASFISGGTVYKTVDERLGTFGSFLIFGLNTVCNGEEYDIKADIKWYLPVPEKFNSQYLHLYKTDTDGNLTELDFIYNDGYVVFISDETGIFTLYSDEKTHTGDVNNDGKISVKDARAVLRYIAKLDTLDEASVKNADADLNGKITVADARLLLRYIAGMEILDYIGN